MGKYAYDLHIHSCLSPCGDDDSTPANIAQLASMLELQIAALTDHNTCKNCPAFFEVASRVSLVPIAGMELTTAEEIHVLCLFPTLDKAMAFDAYVETQLFPMDNDPEIFGHQYVMDATDKITAEVKQNLIQATTIDIYQVDALMREYGGLFIPAHIERTAFSLLSSLGMVPDDCGFDCVEIRSKAAVENLCEQHPYLRACSIIHDSDAHRLEDIALPVNRIALDACTPDALLCALSQTYRSRYER